MTAPFKPIGAVVASLPLPYTFKHISVHMVRILARMAAKKAVQEQLRSEGVRLTLVSPREINERATTYLHDHPEVWREALARAHQIDEAEGQRKEKRRLRRSELARLVRLAPLSTEQKTPKALVILVQPDGELTGC
jgi:hypothetical protein